MWRGHHSRSRFGRHVDIIRRYEQLKGAAAEGADTQPEERDLAEEVRWQVLDAVSVTAEHVAE